MKLAHALQMVALTDPGLVRSNNEDAVFIDPALGIAVLADGMGGYNGGEVASGMAITLLANNFAALLDAPNANEVRRVEQFIASEVLAANLAIFNTAQRQPQYANMATTLVLACFYNNRMTVAHLGDSRLYRLRGSQLEQLTHDHSLLQEQLDGGMITPEAARHSHHRNLVTRGLGVAAQVDTEIHTHAVQAGDLLLLCSDGLTDMLEDGPIAEALQSPGDDLAGKAEQLVHLANLSGGRDNISVILVKIRGDYAMPGTWWQKLCERFK